MIYVSQIEEHSPMTDSTVVYTDLTDSLEAGRALGAKILEDFAGRSPDALIVFALDDRRE